MKYLPIENITYKTKLGSKEVILRLMEQVESPYSSSLEKPYEGLIQKNTFIITRVIMYRNSFSPRIKGVVQQSQEGSLIRVEMRLHNLILWLTILWFGGIGFTCVLVVTKIFWYNSFDAVMMLPFFMLILGYTLTIGGFKYESLRSKEFLAKVLEAEIV